MTRFSKNGQRRYFKLTSRIQIFLNMGLLHTRLNSTARHKVARKRRKRREASKKVHYKDPTEKDSLLTRDLKAFRDSLQI